jgi:hypothetical protein
MEINQLTGSDVLGIDLDQESTCFNLKLKAKNGKLYTLSFWNGESAKISVVIHRLSISLIYDSGIGALTLGELEFISNKNGVTEIDADCISLTVESKIISIN